MKTITEDYVSFEIAKLLKEKGFDVPTDHFYSPNGAIQKSLGLYPNCETNVTMSAPTIQMAMKWLRKKHYIYADPIKQGNYNDCSEYYTWIVAQMGIIHRNSSVADKLSYGGAAEAAIKYCLENLI